MQLSAASNIVLPAAVRTAQAKSRSDARDEILARTAWATTLTGEELRRAEDGLSERRFARGSYICHKGDELDYWTGVTSGLVKIGVVSRNGKAMTFAGATDGSWFGEGSVLKGEPRRYDVVAIRDTRLALLRRATFIWLYENSIAFNHYLVRALNERLGQFLATTEYDRILGPKARVARTLSLFFDRMLNPGAGPAVEISQEELSQVVGVSRQMVNRSLRELQQEGLLEVERNRISPRNIAALMIYEA